MGLDAVELVMAIEEEFGIDITDAEAEKLRTPRLLIDFIWAKKLRNELYVKPPAPPRLLQHLGWQNSTGQASQEVVATHDSLAKRVRELITEQIGVGKFSDDDRFVEDMKID